MRSVLVPVTNSERFPGCRPSRRLILKSVSNVKRRTKVLGINETDRSSLYLETNHSATMANQWAELSDYTSSACILQMHTTIAFYIGAMNPISVHYVGSRHFISWAIFLVCELFKNIKHNCKCDHGYIMYLYVIYEHMCVRKYISIIKQHKISWSAVDL